MAMNHYSDARTVKETPRWDDNHGVDAPLRVQLGCMAVIICTGLSLAVCIQQNDSAVRTCAREIAH